MPQNELYTAINEVETYLSRGFRLLGMYILVKKSELYGKFEKVYSSLPQELVNNRDYLQTQHEENIFTVLSKINFILENSKTFSNFIVINTNVLMNYIDKMYAAIPEDVQICRKKDI